MQNNETLQKKSLVKKAGRDKAKSVILYFLLKEVNFVTFFSQQK